MLVHPAFRKQKNQGFEAENQIRFLWLFPNFWQPSDTDTEENNSTRLVDNNRDGQKFRLIFEAYPAKLPQAPPMEVGSGENLFPTNATAFRKHRSGFAKDAHELSLKDLKHGGVCAANGSVADTQKPVALVSAKATLDQNSTPNFTSQARNANGLSLCRSHLACDFELRFEPTPLQFRAKRTEEFVQRSVCHSRVWPWSSLRLTSSNPELEEDFCSQVKQNYFRFGSAVRIKMSPAWSQQHTFSSQKCGPTYATSIHYTAKNACGTMAN